MRFVAKRFSRPKTKHSSLIVAEAAGDQRLEVTFRGPLLISLSFAG
jgi:hypothetical protein